MGAPRAGGRVAGRINAAPKGKKAQGSCRRRSRDAPTSGQSQDTNEGPNVWPAVP
ncbi:hypothetical protein SGM_0152 [Streptomyces griseoaurantiacus M045]|uniref:Uncharacterized protein n=1 Tax=Streptomyces griseoaurantiacus M045 TaxID=996637 RepID=F3N9W8_9ACTN|nr:hypothetical protein SGM_0152 [Streptomyces griseoaurantiacus M045]